MSVPPARNAGLPQHPDQQVPVGGHAVELGAGQRAGEHAGPPRPGSAPRRSPWPASGRSARRPPSRPRRRSRGAARRRQRAELGATPGHLEAVQRAGRRQPAVRPGPRRRAGPRSRARAAAAAPANGSGRPRRRRSCSRDQVEPGDALGDRVLDLQPGVHLQEVELAVGREQELDRAGADVADRPGRGDRRRRTARRAARRRPPATAPPR